MLTKTTSNEPGSEGCGFLSALSPQACFGEEGFTHFSCETYLNSLISINNNSPYSLFLPIVVETRHAHTTSPFLLPFFIYQETCIFRGCTFVSVPVFNPIWQFQNSTIRINNRIRTEAQSVSFSIKTLSVQWSYLNLLLKETLLNTTAVFDSPFTHAAAAAAAAGLHIIMRSPKKQANWSHTGSPHASAHNPHWVSVGTSVMRTVTYEELRVGFDFPLSKSPLPLPHTEREAWLSQSFSPLLLSSWEPWIFLPPCSSHLRFLKKLDYKF